MTRWIAVLLAALAITGATAASAQETVPGPGSVVVTLILAVASYFAYKVREARRPKTAAPAAT